MNNKFLLFFVIFSFHSMAGKPRATKHLASFIDKKDLVSFDSETGKKKKETVDRVESPIGTLEFVEFSSKEENTLILYYYSSDPPRIRLSISVTFPNYTAAREVKELLENDQEFTLALEGSLFRYINNDANLKIKLPDSDEYVNLETNPENVLGHEGFTKVVDCLFPVNINEGPATLENLMDDTIAGYTTTIGEAVVGLVLRTNAKWLKESSTFTLDKLMAANGEKDAAKIAKANACLKRGKRLKLIGNLLIVDGIATPIVHYFDRKVSPTALTRAVWIGGKAAWDKGSEAMNSYMGDDKGEPVKNAAPQSDTETSPHK